MSLKALATAGSVSRRAALLTLLLAIATPLRLQAQDPRKPLGFGIVPQQAASRLAEDWAPLLAEISRRSGVPLAFRTAPSIPIFEERLGLGDYDLAYMNPYHYVVFHAASG